jgi:TfoX/Sxy family transcriptional regulator of competence genes
VAYDPDLDARVGEIVEAWGAIRKQMFGGTGYLLDGNMLGGVIGDELIVRLGQEDDSALGMPGVRPFDLTGRPMRGWVMVDVSVLDGDALAEWLERAREFVVTLPPK